MGSVQSGIGFPENEQGGKSGIPFYKVSDMNLQGNNDEMLTSNNYVNEEQINRRKWKVNDKGSSIIFAKVGAAVMLNRKRLVNGRFLLDNNMMSYTPNDSLNILFTKALFNMIYLPGLIQTGALPSYNASDILAIKVITPKLCEQEKMGKLFKNIDSLTTLYERKLEKLKILEKLKKMKSRYSTILKMFFHETYTL